MAGKSKILSKLVKGAAGAGLAGGAAYVAFGGDSVEQDALASQPATPPADAGLGGTSKQTNSTSTTTQTTKREGSAPVVAAPKLPEAERAQPLVRDPSDVKLYQDAYKSMAQTPEQKALFRTQKSDLDKAIAEVMSDYKQASKEAKAKGEEEATRARYASVAEGLANAALTIAAAQQGLRDGRAYAGSLQLTRSDWTGEIDKAIARALNERQTLRADAGDAVKELDTKRKLLTEAEEKAVGREERAGERLADADGRVASDVRGINARRTETGVASGNANKTRQVELGLSAAQSNASNAAAYAPTNTSTTQTRTGEEEGVGGARGAAVKEGRIKAFGSLSGALEELKGKDTPENRRKVITQATLLGMSEEDKAELLKESTGAGIWNLADQKNVQKVLKRYDPNVSLPGAGDAPGQPAPVPAGTPVPAGQRRVRAGSGQVILVKESNLPALFKADPKAQILD